MVMVKLTEAVKVDQNSHSFFVFAFIQNLHTLGATEGHNKRTIAWMKFLKASFASMVSNNRQFLQNDCFKCLLLCATWLTL
jgi:hypothetical protein